MSYFAQELLDALRDPQIRGELVQLLGEALATPETRTAFCEQIREAMTAPVRPWTTQEAAQALGASVKVFNNWAVAEPAFRDLAEKKGGALLWPCRETKMFWDLRIAPRLKPRRR